MAHNDTLASNPYAPPQAPIGTPPATGECWREKRRVAVPIGSDLPNRCIRCNAPGVVPAKTRSFRYHSPWWYLLLLYWPIYALGYVFFSRKNKLSPGLCEKHHARRKMWLAVTWLALFGGIGFIALGVDGDDTPVYMAIGAALILLAMVATTRTYLIRIVKIGDGRMQVGGCKRPFLRSLPDRNALRY